LIGKGNMADFKIQVVASETEVDRYIKCSAESVVERLNAAILAVQDSVENKTYEQQLSILAGVHNSLEQTKARLTNQYEIVRDIVSILTPKPTEEKAAPEQLELDLGDTNEEV